MFALYFVAVTHVQAVQGITIKAMGTYAIIYFALLLLGGMAVCTFAKALRKNDKAPLSTRRMLTIILCCWLPYIAFLYPASVSTDSVTQMKSLIGIVPLSNANPLFQTLIVGAVMFFGKLIGNMDLSLFMYVLTQAVLMAWMFAYTLKCLQRFGATRGVINAGLIFFAIHPIFPLYALCMGKDTNFSMAMLWFSVTIANLLYCKSDEKPTKSTVFALTLSSLLCMLLRNPGVMLVGLMLVLLLIVFTLEKKYKQIPAIIISGGSVLVVYICLHMVVLPLFQIADTPKSENYSLPLQQVGRIVIKEEPTEEMLSGLHGVIDVSAIKDTYRPEISDDMKNMYRENASDADRKLFFSTWLELLRHYPLTGLEATIHNSFGYLTPGYVTSVKPPFLIGRQGRIDHLSEAYRFTTNDLSYKLDAVMDALLAFAPTRFLLAPGLYGLFCVFVFFALCNKKNKVEMLIALPALFLLLGTQMSSVNGYFRYALPTYFCTPLLFFLLYRKVILTGLECKA